MFIPAHVYGLTCDGDAEGALLGVSGHVRGADLDIGPPDFEAHVLGDGWCTQNPDGKSGIVFWPRMEKNE